MSISFYLPLISPFIDENGIAWGHISIIGEDGSIIQSDPVLLESEDMTDYFAMILREEKGRDPTPKQIEDLRRVVRGNAREKPRRKPPVSTEAALPELAPLGKVVLAMVRRWKELELASEEWVRRVAAFAKQLQLDITGMKGWPGNAVALGQRFAELREPLRAHGVDLTPTHTDLRYWKAELIERKELAPAESPTAEPSSTPVPPESPGQQTQMLTKTIEATIENDEADRTEFEKAFHGGVEAPKEQP